MRKTTLMAFAITFLALSSCGDDELAPTPNEDNPTKESVTPEPDIFIIPDSAITVSSVPSYVTEALNNAKLLFDNLGETNEIKSDNIHYYVTDDKGNIFVVDTLGNLDIRTFTKDIHIDSSVRENTIAKNDTICNTTWKGWGNDYVGTPRVVDIIWPERDSTYCFFDAEFEETIYLGEESSYTKTEPICNRELKFYNSTCILTTWDTVRECRITHAPKFRKIKVKEQEYTTKSGISYKIEIKNDTLYVYDSFTKDPPTNLISKQALDSDSTFSVWDETFETISKEVIETRTHHKSVVYNYKTNDKGEIYLYDNKFRYEPYYFKNGEMGFVSSMDKEYVIVQTHYKKVVK